MAIKSSVVTIAATATLISPTSDDNVAGVSVSILNSGSVVVYIGGAGVTTANGYPIAAGSALSIGLMSESVYGIVASGTSPVNILEESA